MKNAASKKENGLVDCVATASAALDLGKELSC